MNRNFFFTLTVSVALAVAGHATNTFLLSAPIYNCTPVIDGQPAGNSVGYYIPQAGAPDPGNNGYVSQVCNGQTGNTSSIYFSTEYGCNVNNYYPNVGSASGCTCGVPGSNCVAYLQNFFIEVDIDACSDILSGSYFSENGNSNFSSSSTGDITLWDPYPSNPMPANDTNPQDLVTGGAYEMPAGLAYAYLIGNYGYVQSSINDNCSTATASVWGEIQSILQIVASLLQVIAS